MSDASTVDWETDIDDDDDSHCPSTLDKASTSDDGEDADFDVIDPSKDSTTTIILPQPEMVFELPETLKRNALTTNQDSSPGHTAIEASVANNGPECARSVNTAGSTAAESFVPVQALSRLNVGDSAQSSLCSNYTSNNSSVSQDQIRIDSKIANSSRWKHRGEEDDDTWASESWTRVGDADSDVTSLVTFTTTEGPSNSAVDDDASSLISDFDIISLSGASKRRCKMCTYINRDQDCLCQGCGRALLANPCVEVDEQIAKHLQMQEEDLAFKTVLLKEKKRSNISMQPLLVQSQLLSDDITDYVQTCLTDNRDTLSSNAVGLCANPSGSLNVIMSNFIEYVLACKRDASSSCPCKVSVAFHFSRTSESGTSTIRHHGFAASSPFSENANVALIDGSQANRPTMARRSAIALTAIPENEVVVDSSESNYLGWIAAIATGEGSKKQFGKGECSEGGKDAAVVTTLNNNYSVPLLCFDASLRNHKIIQRLRRGKF